MKNKRINGDAFSISGLKKDQKIEIDYQSQGCFHNKSFRFLFSTNEVTIYATSNVYQADNKLGKLKLSDIEIKGLDALVQLIQSENDSSGFSTTTEVITLKVLEGQAVLQEYIFHDDPCIKHENNQILTLGQLLEKLRV